MKKLTALILVLVCIFGLVGCSNTHSTLFDYKKLERACEQERAIPRIDIDTFGCEIVSKEDYVDCTVSISGTEIDKYSAGIRGKRQFDVGAPQKTISN